MALTLELSPGWHFSVAPSTLTALPLAFQLPLVKLFGFRNVQQFMDEVDRRKAANANQGD